MGKVCVSHDTLLITDDDSTTQDHKSLPPCMQLQAGVGFNFLPSESFQHEPTPSLAIARRGGFFSSFFFKSTNDDDDDEPCRLVVVVCLRLHPRQRRQPTPSLAIARRGGFLLSFFSFFKATNDDDDEPCRLVVVICLRLHPRQRRQPTPLLAIARRGGFLLSFFSSQRTPTCLRLHDDDDDDEPCRLVVVICLHLYPRQPNNPPPRLQLRDGVGFLSSFFSSQRTPTTMMSHVLWTIFQAC